MSNIFQLNKSSSQMNQDNAVQGNQPSTLFGQQTTSIFSSINSKSNPTNFNQTSNPFFVNASGNSDSMTLQTATTLQTSQQNQAIKQSLIPFSQNSSTIQQSNSNSIFGNNSLPNTFNTQSGNSNPLFMQPQSTQFNSSSTQPSIEGVMASQASCLFFKNQNQIQTSTPEFTLFSQPNLSTKANDLFLKPSNSNSTQNIEPNKVSLQNGNNQGLLSNTNLSVQKSSPLFGGEMSPIEKKADSEKQFDSNQISMTKVEQKNNSDIRKNDIDSVEQLSLNTNTNTEEGEDDLNLGDFTSKPYATNVQVQKQEQRVSRLESNRYDDEEDLKNLGDFGTKDTRVAEQEMIIKQEQRTYQKIDVQKALVDLQIENDYLKKEVKQQSNTILQLSKQIPQFIQNHDMALKRLKEIHQIEIKKQQTMKETSLERLQCYEKKFSFEVLKCAMLRKLDQTKYQETINDLQNKLEMAKYDRMKFEFQLEESQELLKSYQQELSQAKPYKNLYTKSIDFKQKVVTILLKQRKITEEELSFDSAESVIISQLEKEFSSVTLIQIKEQLSLIKQINSTLQTNNLKLEDDNKRLTGQIEKQILHNLGLEEVNRENQILLQSQSDLNSKLQFVNEEQQLHFTTELENQKSRYEELKKQSNTFYLILIVMLPIILALIGNFLFKLI